MNNTNNKSGIKPFIFAGVGVGLFILAMYFQFSKPGFTMVDIYTDSTDKGKYIFLFVETEADNESDIINWAYDIKNEDNLLAMPDKTKPAMITMYFYNPKDTIELDDNIEKTLREKYSDKIEFTKKINYSPSGWQYIGHNDKTINMPADTVFKSYIFVPKPGYRAKEIIQQLNR
ncbi:MAG: hypothetical protein WCZ17_05870 [Candidatus Kapaibacterium sp.]|jgi:hypothetical protein|nr:hypothetical protein [Candidatus Kapabacteria bacterium]